MEGWAVSGVRRVVRRRGPVAPGWLFDVYVAVEAEVESDAFRNYHEVLGIVSDRLAERMGIKLDAAGRDRLAEALPDWPLFPDTNGALLRLKQRYRLGVLSNIDRDLFAGTCRSFGVSFDFVVTAKDVESYKPNPGHFERMLDEYGDRDTTVHVAQSLFHDGVPAERLQLPFVWINRYGQSNETGVAMAAEYPDLVSLARVAETA